MELEKGVTRNCVPVKSNEPFATPNRSAAYAKPPEKELVDVENPEMPSACVPERKKSVPVSATPAGVRAALGVQPRSLAFSVPPAAQGEHSALQPP